MPRSERERRGTTTSLDQLPAHVADCLRHLARQFGEVRLWGSYERGNWADDSDLDVRIREPRAWAHPIATRIGARHGLKVDVFSWHDDLGMVVR